MHRHDSWVGASESGLGQIAQQRLGVGIELDGSGLDGISPVAAGTYVGLDVGLLGAVVGAGAMPVASEPQARATAQPPATSANRLRHARRDRFPPRSLSVVFTVWPSAQLQLGYWDVWTRYVA